MKVRIITAIVGIIAVLFLVWLGSWFLTAAVMAVALLALLEYDKMLCHFNVRVYLKPAALAMLFMIGVAGFYSVKAFLAGILLSFILFSVSVLLSWQVCHRLWRKQGRLWLRLRWRL